MSPRKVGLSILFASILIGLVIVLLRPGSRPYPATGTVVGFGSDTLTVFIAHGEIPGFMPAMTMPFEVVDPAQLAGLGTGDSIAFEIRLRDGRTRAGRLRLIEPGTDRPDSYPHGHTRGPAVGTQVPSAVLIDQDGRRFDPGDPQAEATLVTFIYTRCPLPDYCPLMSRRFQELQEPLVDDYGDRVRLLSISFDPEYDTPSVLHDYARRYTRDTRSWKFATGPPADVRRVTDFFGVTYEFDGQYFDHNLGTALVDSTATVRAYWPGNSWTAESVLETVRAYFSAAD